LARLLHKSGVRILATDVEEQAHLKPHSQAASNGEESGAKPTIVLQFYGKPALNLTNCW
jgi:hypothetical protein